MYTIKVLAYSSFAGTKTHRVYSFNLGNILKYFVAFKSRKIQKLVIFNYFVESSTSVWHSPDGIILQVLLWSVFHSYLQAKAEPFSHNDRKCAKEKIGLAFCSIQSGPLVSQFKKFCFSFKNLKKYVHQKQVGNNNPPPPLRGNYDFSNLCRDLQ